MLGTDYEIDYQGLGCRFNTTSKENGEIQAALDAANEEFRGFERRDIKLREDAKHLRARAKKLADKLSKDMAKAEVCASLTYFV